MFDVKRLERHHGITWNELVELEPRLDGLLCDAQCSRPLPEEEDDFNYEIAWGQFKQPIADLVGYFRHDNCDPRLTTVGAYEVAYYTLWHTLHD